MHAPRLIAITDAQSYGADVTVSRMQTLCALARPGTVAVQLRDTGLPIRDRLELGQRLRELTRRYAQRLLVNDRIDLAWLLSADGVHLGEASLVVADARRAFAARGMRCWVSAATHEVQSNTEADALLLAPIFSSRKGLSPLGLPTLTRQSRATPNAKVYALGGVGTEQAKLCAKCGAYGVAAISSAYETPQPLLSSLELLR